MALLARVVLADCKKIYDLLELETDKDKFLIYCVAGMALLRSVGHVLDKVDSKRSDKIARSINSAWGKWKDNREDNQIFWEFIEEERNNILKEYSFNYQDDPVDLLVLPSEELFQLDENLFCPIHAGPFEGEDIRDIMREAILWWECELSPIEKSC